jgi:hypothetical protein
MAGPKLPSAMREEHQFGFPDLFVPGHQPGVMYDTRRGDQFVSGIASKIQFR